MDFYILTSEFWLNLLWISLACLTAFIGLVVLIRGIGRVFGDGGDGDGCGCLVFIIFFVLSVIISVPSALIERMDFSTLWAPERGPLAILEKEAPLLRNYYETLKRVIQKNETQVNLLKQERDNSTTESAKDIYTAQINALTAGVDELKGMVYRINSLAQRLYFSKYLAQLGQISPDPTINRELREVQEACARLIHE